MQYSNLGFGFNLATGLTTDPPVQRDYSLQHCSEKSFPTRSNQSEPAQAGVGTKLLALINFIPSYLRRLGLWWLERLPVKQEDLGLIPPQTKCFFFSPWAQELGKINGSRHDKLCDIAYPCR